MPAVLVGKADVAVAAVTVLLPRRACSIASEAVATVGLGVPEAPGELVELEEVGEKVA